MFSKYRFTKFNLNWNLSYLKIIKNRTNLIQINLFCLKAEYEAVNRSGEATTVALIVAEVISCFKRSLARMLVIIVSLGFGIVKYVNFFFQIKFKILTNIHCGHNLGHDWVPQCKKWWVWAAFTLYSLSSTPCSE